MIRAIKRRRLLSGADCEVRFDGPTRQLYATDASIYQIEPYAVAFPRSAQEAASALRAATEADLSVIPRGAGTGLAGGAVGDGLVVDMARHTKEILDLDLDRRTVRVGAGVVLDQLNDYLKPHGLCFGPDVATSSRATLGGMISSNSSGARAPIYGVTVDHVVEAEIVLADGTISRVGAEHEDAQPHLAVIDELVGRNADLIRERFPDILVKRWPGYQLDRYLRARGDLSKVIGGSEGTLAVIASATLGLVPVPKKRGLGLVFFASVDEAMRATVHLLDLKPAAIEHVDRLVFDQTQGQLAFEATREFLRLDDESCGALLVVEFYDHVADRLAALSRRKLGLRTQLCTDQREMDMVWALRKQGLSLLTSLKGPAKPIGGLEDVAIRPKDLPEYVKALESVVVPLGLKTSFYGHAASGLVHVRPVIDLHRADSIAKYRQVADEVSALTKQFHGSLAGEHGVGMARTEFMEDHIGPELMNVMREIKALYDPKGLMNPGKIFPDRDYRIDNHLRLGDGHEIPTPFEPTLAFRARDGLFVANLEQCNGCGECRKEAPTMCPTFMATGDEIMSTRGRANTIRAVLEGRIVDSDDPLSSAALAEALSNCLSCKACKAECPSNVDMALLKSELVHAYHQEAGLSLLEVLVSRFDLLGRLGCTAPGLANAALGMRWLRKLMEWGLGFAAKRPLPRYTHERFDRWFAARPRRTDQTRGWVTLWDDCAVRYHEPNIGKAAVKVLEAAGYGVVLPRAHRCCGRPAFSVGRLDVVKEFAEPNVRLLLSSPREMPVIFLEASCYSMFANDYAELKIPGAERVGERCVLFEQFMFDLLEREPDALALASDGQKVAIHGHCHAKALTDVSVLTQLAQRIPNSTAAWLETGCCGMAGSFGALRDKYELSLAVAQPLVEQVDALEQGTRVVASGTSCRQQIEHLSHAHPVHMAELLADALADS